MRAKEVSMSTAIEQLFQTIRALPAEERLELLDALLVAERETGPLPFDPSWLPEIQRRSAEIDAGTVKLSTWDEVRERVRRRLQGPANG